MPVLLPLNHAKEKKSEMLYPSYTRWLIKKKAINELEQVDLYYKE